MDTRIPELLTNTVSTGCKRSRFTLVLGVSTAWLVTRVEFPARRLWEGALVLPLAMPTYVLAYIYSYLLGIRRAVEHLWQPWPALRRESSPPTVFWVPRS